jgi:hypothetical protein
MAIDTKPEILRPRGGKAVGAFSNENLDLLSHLLDDFIRIPGTPIRFGLDGIVGFIPGVGDILGGLASSILIVAAWMRGVRKVTIARMVLNVAIETAVGSLPVVGDLFDIAWRANRRNYKLLEASLHEPERHTLGSWLYLGSVCLALAVLMVLPILLAAWIWTELTRAFGTRG